MANLNEIDIADLNISQFKIKSHDKHLFTILDDERFSIQGAAKYNKLIFEIEDLPGLRKGLDAIECIIESKKPKQSITKEVSPKTEKLINPEENAQTKSKIKKPGPIDYPTLIIKYLKKHGPSQLLAISQGIGTDYATAKRHIDKIYERKFVEFYWKKDFQGPGRGKKFWALTKINAPKEIQKKQSEKKEEKRGRPPETDNYDTICKFLKEYGESTTSDVANFIRESSKRTWNYMKYLFDKKIISSRKNNGKRTWYLIEQTEEKPEVPEKHQKEQLEPKKEKPEPKKEQPEPETKYKVVETIRIPIENPKPGESKFKTFNVIKKEEITQNG